MGIVIRQTIRGSFISYLGVAFGFITVGLLWPRFMEPSEIGLINFLVALSAILAQVGSLGINNVSVRLFPHFRDDASKHHGFLSFGLLFLLAGSFLVLAYYLVFRERIVENNLEKSVLLSRYVYFIVPFTVATLVYNYFDSLHRVIYDAVIGVFLKEFVFRVLNLLLILLYAWTAFSFHLFLNIYFLIFSLPALILVLALIRTRQFNLRLEPGFVHGEFRRSVLSVSFFGLVAGMSTIAISSIDKIMINHYIDLEATGIYSIAFLFGTIITLPSRPMAKIATTIVAEAWKNDDTASIQEIYTKSSLTQFIIGGLIFLLVWLNIDLVFMLIPEKYESGRMVILLMSLSGVVLMVAGLNGIILQASRYYMVHSLFVFALLVALVLTNMIFIPRMGITGAALASLISTVFYNVLRILFIRSRFRMQPFNYKYLIVLGLLIIAWWVGSRFLFIESWWMRTLIICLAISLLYLLPIWIFRISHDINDSIQAFFHRLSGKQNR
jgi:O-antigen/teichoic acid export membrane protein